MNQITEKQPLSKRQQEYFEFIRQFSLDHHRLPILHEIRDGMGLKSHNGANWAIQKLIERGWLRTAAGGRGYVLADFGEWSGEFWITPGQSLSIGNTYIGLELFDPRQSRILLKIITDGIQKPERNPT